MFLPFLWTITVLGGVTGLLNPPQLLVPTAADARKAFTVQCNYGLENSTKPPDQQTETENLVELDERIGNVELDERIANVRRRQTVDGAIHSLKLKVDGDEVFKYMPSGVTEYTIFDNARAQLKSYFCSGSSCSVKVQVLAGRRSWRCEVSAEWPTFDLMSSEATVDVVAEPIYGPTIVGEPNEAVSPGSVVFLNCSTDLAAPPAGISWLVDDVLVEESSMSAAGVGQLDELGLRKSYRGVRVHVPTGEGDVTVQCVAKQPGVVGQRRAKIILQRAQPKISKYTASAGFKTSAASFIKLSALLVFLVLNNR